MLVHASNVTINAHFVTNQQEIVKFAKEKQELLIIFF